MVSMVNKLDFSSLSESEIASEVRNKNEGLIEYLYKKYLPMAQSFTKHSSISVQIEDVYQESFMVLLNKLYEGDLSCKISTFLYSVIRNHYLKAIRDNKSGLFQDTHEFIDVEDDVNDYEEEQRRLDSILNKIAELGKRCQEVIKQFYLKSKSMDEIANDMGYTNADNVKNQKYKCMKQLKSLIHG